MPFGRSFKRVVAFLLLLWLPLQSVAQPALMLGCELGEMGAWAMVGAPGDAQDEPPCHGGGDEQAGDEASTPLAHGCCHNVAFAPSAIGALASDVLRAPRDALQPPHGYRFFPEQPQRPPLAAL